jgi:HEAT repeat protein
VRLEAALELGKLADVHALPALLDRVGTEPDFFVRENVTWALVRMGDAAVLPLIAILERGDTTSRFHAAHTLSKLADVRAVPALLVALDASDSELVQKSVYALGALRDERALPALLARIGETSGAFRSTLHDAVSAFGVHVVPALLAVLADRASALATKVEVVEILGSIGGSEVIAPLAQALQDDAWEVRFAAVNALRRQSDAATVGTLAPATQDPHPHVRMLATRAMQDLT